MKFLLLLSVPLLVLISSVRAVGQDAIPSYDRDIRPILSQHCFKCHGPDEQEGNLRFDDPETWRKEADSGETAIVDGKPEKSELLRRVSSVDEDEVMPPDGKQLTQQQTELLRKWIKAGAKYESHWAYRKPVRPKVPKHESNSNAIDAFVRTRLSSKDSLTPSVEADRISLLRRLTIDLTGLPPTPEEADAFLADSSANAYEKIVDRLIASRHYGERWASPWLDLARYGESAGGQHDIEMPLWPYRDWLINALNNDMPFDEFTRQQIAGDLMPRDAVDSLSPVIATGFHRGATATLGADQNAKDLRAQLIWDRVNTVGTTWLGITLECAQCHTHKFDPITIKDYYSIYAYFNRTTKELTKVPGSHYYVTGGVLELPTTANRSRRERELREAINAETDIVIRKLAGANRNKMPTTLRFVLSMPKKFREAERILFNFNSIRPGAKIPETVRKNIARTKQLGVELMKIRAPRSLVLVEDANPSPTHVLLRGSTSTPGEVVMPSTPKSLHPLPEDALPNRLALAEWLVSPENPLTSRVVVNRWWAEFFGTGIVATPEDFGLQGERPSNPELLDWLANEFMTGGSSGRPWSMKHIHKLIVMSQTYRQSSHWSKKSPQDASNYFLSRGSRFRWSAEILRDQALAVAGMLDRTSGGPSVAATFAAAKANGDSFTWRRSVYIRQQRGKPYSTFRTFDAPVRFTCVARRPRTNTPLQALALMNEPVFAFASRRLAERIQKELPDGDTSTRALRLFRICLIRPPTNEELTELIRIYDNTVASDGNESNAWFRVANVILNLDEMLNHE